MASTPQPPYPYPGAQQPPYPGPPANGSHPSSSSASSSATPSDSYFTESRKGEVNELRQLLRTFSSERDPNRKREIIKKVIAYMTLGIDVSRLFTEMMLAIETRDLVIKKMVYLFLCNYATSHPDLAQMCTNTLQKDCGNDDPMVRGLALRALCSLRLPQMVEYISEPLRKSLTDHHAYVRKTGVMGILKLYHLDVEAFEKCNFVDILYDMLRDPDASVVTNCILVLNEIMAMGPDGGMAINRPIMLHLLNRIHEFSEFGIVTVLELVPRYRAVNEEEAFQIMNLLDPILRTSNSGAVLATLRAFLSLAEQLEDKQAMTRQVVLRVKAPLVTLAVAGIPELVYCLFQNISSLINLCPGIFDDEYRQFYIRYSEPTHVKYLKLQILPKLANSTNSPDIVDELAEYVNDVNVKLSRLAVRGLSSIACRDVGGDNCAEAIVLRLVEMMDLDVNHVQAEAACALADVLRKHVQLGDMVQHRLPRALRYVTEPKGKASILFLLGEWGDSVKEAPYCVEKMIDSYDTLTDPKIKMALLMTTMKLFFKRPPECHNMLGRLLKKATEDVTDQDLHDRALFYHRLLKTDPKIAEAVVAGTTATIPLSKKFAEEDDGGRQLQLMKEFNTLSILYGKTSDNFIAEEYQVKFVMMPEHSEEDEVPPPIVGEGEVAALQHQLGEVSLLENGQPEPTPVVSAPPVSNLAADGGVVDLLDFGEEPTPAPVIPPSTIPTLSLHPGVTMTGDIYQSMWGEQPETINITLPFKTLPNTSDVETALASQHILTMASGELPTELKFFLYCQEGSSDKSIFLIQAVLTKNPMQLNLVIKTKAEKYKADLLVDKFKDVLGRFM